MGIEIKCESVPDDAEGAMISRAHHQFADPVSRGYGRVTGYVLFLVIAVLLVLALMSNPVLPH